MAWDLTRRLSHLVRRGLATGVPLWPYYLVVYGVGLLHLVEVHLLDPVATGFARDLLGGPLVVFAWFEAPFYQALGQAWVPGVVASAGVYYLAGFVILLVWTPYLVAMTGDRRALKRVLLTYPVIYAIGLPGYLLLPQLNPYVALGLGDPFSVISPSLEAGYYLFTTPDNTLPSLHVAYTVALTAHLARVYRPGRRILWTLGGLLVASVVYLRVHWLGDVAAGLVVAWVGLTLADRMARRAGPLGDAIAWLDRLGWRGARWALARARQLGWA